MELKIVNIIASAMTMVINIIYLFLYVTYMYYIMLLLWIKLKNIYDSTMITPWMAKGFILCSLVYWAHSCSLEVCLENSSKNIESTDGVCLSCQ